MSIDELELAQLLTELIPSPNRVEFGENGGDAPVAVIALLGHFWVGIWFLDVGIIPFWLCMIGLSVQR